MSLNIQALADMASADGYYLQIVREGQPYGLAPPDKLWAVYASKSGFPSYITRGPTIAAALTAVIDQRLAES